MTRERERERETDRQTDRQTDRVREIICLSMIGSIFVVGLYDNIEMCYFHYHVDITALLLKL